MGYCEAQAFRAIYGLPDSLYGPVWVIMQLGTTPATSSSAPLPACSSTPPAPGARSQRPVVHATSKAVRSGQLPLFAGLGR